METKKSKVIRVYGKTYITGYKSIAKGAHVAAADGQKSLCGRPYAYTVQATDTTDLVNRVDCQSCMKKVRA